MAVRLRLFPFAFILTALVLAPFAIPQEAPDENDANIEALLNRPSFHVGWSPEFTIAGFSGPDGFAPVVYDFAEAPDGDVLATGRFRWIGDQLVDPVVRLKDSEWTPVKEEWPVEMPQTGFSAIAVDDEGVTALATYSGPFGQLPIEIWLASDDDVRVIAELRGSVRSMVWFEDRLWVAGFFQLDSIGVANLAVWDGATWSEPPGGPADSAVYRLSPAGDSLLLAGDFTTVGGIPARGVAEWDGETWQAYDLPGARIFAVARTESGDLYAGGALPSGGVVRWNGSAWEELGGGLFFGEGGGVASDLAMYKRRPLRHRLLLARRGPRLGPLVDTRPLGGALERRPLGEPRRRLRRRRNRLVQLRRVRIRAESVHHLGRRPPASVQRWRTSAAGRGYAWG